MKEGGGLNTLTLPSFSKMDAFPDMLVIFFVLVFLLEHEVFDTFPDAWLICLFLLSAFELEMLSELFPAVPIPVVTPEGFLPGPILN